MNGLPSAFRHLPLPQSLLVYLQPVMELPSHLLPGLLVWQLLIFFSAAAAKVRSHIVLAVPLHVPTPLFPGGVQMHPVQPAWVRLLGPTQFMGRFLDVP